MAKKGRRVQGGVNPQAALSKAISKRFKNNDDRNRNLTRAGASAAISSGGSARRALSDVGTKAGGRTSMSFVGAKGSTKGGTGFSVGGNSNFGGGKKVFNGKGKAANAARRKGAGTSPFTNTGRPGAAAGRNTGAVGPRLRGADRGRVVGKPGMPVGKKK